MHIHAHMHTIEHLHTHERLTWSQFTSHAMTNTEPHCNISCTFIMRKKTSSSRMMSRTASRSGAPISDFWLSQSRVCNRSQACASSMPSCSIALVRRGYFTDFHCPNWCLGTDGQLWWPCHCVLLWLLLRCFLTPPQPSEVVPSHYPLQGWCP